jgi:hypothetical protein
VARGKELMTMDDLENVVEEFLNLLTDNEALGRLPLSDAALDCLPRMAGYVWAANEERLSEFVAEHPRFYDKLPDGE